MDPIAGESSSEVPGQLELGRWPELRALIEARFKQKSRDEWAAVFADSDACVSPVLSPWEAHLHPHTEQREGFVEVAGLLQPAPTPRFSRTPNATPRDRTEHELADTLRNWGVAGGSDEPPEQA